MAVLYNKTKGYYIKEDRKDGNHNASIKHYIDNKLWDPTDEIIVTTIEKLPANARALSEKESNAIHTYLMMKEMFGEDGFIDVDDSDAF